MPERGEFLVGEEEGTACQVGSLETGVWSRQAARPHGAGDKCRQPRSREGPERPFHAAETVESLQPERRRCLNDQSQLCIEQMPAEFVSCGLQIVLALMQPAGRGFEVRVRRLGRTPCRQSEKPRESPCITPSRSSREVTSKPMMPLKELSLQEEHRIDSPMQPLPRCRTSGDLDPALNPLFWKDRPQ